jgi:hypothetical protein
MTPEEPATTEVGVHERTVPDAVLSTPSEKMSEEGAFLASPEYLAFRVTSELAEVGVYSTEQAPLLSVQVVVENFP